MVNCVVVYDGADDWTETTLSSEEMHQMIYGSGIEMRITTKLQDLQFCKVRKKISL
jgi:hypothetical protein